MTRDQETTMTETDTPPIRARRLKDERGASLVIALAFIAIFGVVIGSLLQFNSTNSLTHATYSQLRARNYAVDGALDGAINKVKNDSSIGIDPSVDTSTSNVCNPDNNQTLFSLPATTTPAAPSMVVSCVVGADSGSGVPQDLGATPPDAVLTLGDKQTNGTTSSLGVRNTEPGPYNGAYTGSFFGATLTPGGQCDGIKQEAGIRENRSMSPVFLGSLPIGCTAAPNASTWNVFGNVVSNSTISTDDTTGGPTILQDPEGNTGSIKAKYGCTGSGYTCSSTAPTTTELSDPNYAGPDISGLTVQNVPSASLCGTNGGTRNDVVTFSPGIYTDGTALNNLFSNSACKSTTFLFPPVQDATTGEYTGTGLYYFNFQNSSTTSIQCGQEINLFGFITTLQQDIRHEWCIGGAGADYSGQHVIAGAPYDWDPNASPTSSVLTLAPASSAGNGPGLFFGLIPQTTGFGKGDNCGSSDSVKSCGVAIDGKTDNYAMSSSHNGSSIWVSGYPKMARGSITAANIEVAQGATNAASMNNPTVQVNFGSTLDDAFNRDKCGPYTLSKPDPSGTITTVGLATADQDDLTTCLNRGDAGEKINDATIQYNVSRASGSPTAKFDGIKLDITTNKQPSFPFRMPSATDPGGDCDPSQPGSQFIFGGDSHVYVPNGGLEICAGENMSDPLHGQEIGVYDVPAVPRLIPSSVTSTSSGVTNPSNAMQIAEGSGLASASIPYNGSMTLRMPSYSPPAGMKITNLSLRASYNPQTATPSFQIKTTGGSSVCGPTTVASGGGMQANEYPVTSCLSGSIGNPFDITWNANGSGSCSGATCPQLDGFQVIITLGLSNTATDANQRYLVPASGCVTASPNLWYGTGSPDCSLLKVDSSFSSTVSTSRGVLSVKGTIYAPSGVVDIDDTAVQYPIGSRGIIARHLRIRGYQIVSGYGDPAFSNYLNTSQTARAVVFFACQKTSGTCSQSEAIGRAAVSFAADTNTPSIENWSVAKN